MRPDKLSPVFHGGDPEIDGRPVFELSLGIIEMRWLLLALAAAKPLLCVDGQWFGTLNATAERDRELLIALRT